MYTHVKFHESLLPNQFHTEYLTSDIVIPCMELIEVGADKMLTYVYHEWELVDVDDPVVNVRMAETSECRIQVYFSGTFEVYKTIGGQLVQGFVEADNGLVKSISFFRDRKNGKMLY